MRDLDWLKPAILQCQCFHRKQEVIGVVPLLQNMPSLGNEANQSLWISRGTRKSYINHIYWNWQPNDPNIRNIYDNADGMPQSWDHSPIVPILAVVMLAVTVFLLVLFRQNPGLVAGTVAGCLIFIGMYLTLSTLQENKLKFE